MKRQHIIIIVTTASRAEVEKVEQSLPEQKLVACTNIIGPVSSSYWWKGKIEKADKHILLLKSRLDLFEKLAEKVTSLHTYQVPEIIALPVIEGYRGYLKWSDGCLEAVNER